MDEENNSVEPSLLRSTFCRICVTPWKVNHCMQEPCDPGESLSLHCMLEILFPTIFNEHTANWPAKICQDCGEKVLQAYALYVQCGQSAEQLERLCNEQEDATMCDEVMITVRGDCTPDVLVEEAVVISELEPGIVDSATNCNPLEDNSGDSIEEDQVPHRPEIVITKQKLHDKRKNPAATKRKHKRKQPSESDEQVVDATEAPSRTRQGNRRQMVITQMPESVEDKLPEEKSKINVGRRSKAHEQDNATLHNSTASRSDDDTEPNCKQSIGKLNDTTAEEASPREEKLETKKNLYKCVLCDVPAFTGPDALTDHLKAAHPDQIRVCEQCPKVFAAQAAFEQHQYCHATGRSHFCPFCDRGFQTALLLKSHIRTHTQRSDYLCSLCGKEFNVKNNLRQHMIMHSGERPWACPLCPCRFSTKGGLKSHQNTHTRIKAFSCDTCGSQFNKHYSLIKHKLIHTGERPFGCEICKMRFTNSYMVKRHMRTHTGEKPYKCTYCERSFAQSNDMVKHMKTHVGSNPYQCDRCDASFRLLVDLRNHYKEHVQPGEPGAGSSTEEDAKVIRFTSQDILQLRYKKEMNQQQ
uniref:C2H2-type domain-containing protein n=4 Tax=Anopheles merus TaxID=30066 RepID=A0A182UY69_ANOME